MGLHPIFDFLNQQHIAVVGEINHFFPAALVQENVPIGFLQENGSLIPLNNTMKTIMETSMMVAMTQENQGPSLGIWPESFYQIQQITIQQGYHTVLLCEYGTEEYAIQQADKTIATIDHSGNIRAESRSLQQSLTASLQELQTEPQNLRISYQLGLQKEDIKSLARMVEQGKFHVKDKSIRDIALQIAAQEYDAFGQMLQPDLTDEQITLTQEFLAQRQNLLRLEADPASQQEANKLRKDMVEKFGTASFSSFNQNRLAGKYRQEARFTDAQLQTLILLAKDTTLYDTKSVLGQRISQAASRSINMAKKQNKSTSLQVRLEQKKTVR